MNQTVRSAVWCAALLVAAGCQKSDPKLRMTTTTRTPPYTPVPSPAIVALMASQFPGVPSVADILGYNDVQMLQKTALGTDYGPLVSVYVAPKEYQESDYTATGGALVALLEVEGDTAGVPATYNALKLDHSDTTAVYCVYLTLKITSGTRNWDGYVVPVTAAGCPGITPSKKLKADEMVDGTYNGQGDYPWVARFTDTDHDNPTIGVTCMIAWCEIGRGPGNGPSTPVNPTPAPNNTKLKPWFDEQRIADTVGSPLHRSVRAQLSPASRLDTIKQAHYAGATGAKAATVYIDAAPAALSKYARWGLTPAGNDVYIKKFGEDDWRAEFVAVGTTPTGTWPFKVYRTDHPGGPPVPGVARWSWNPLDEEIWLGCDQGCCVVSDDPPSNQNNNGPPGPPPGGPRGAPPPGTKRP